jgi:murein DD-endopeptidase MepM/ murein hydrolase activator NlpD
MARRRLLVFVLVLAALTAVVALTSPAGASAATAAAARAAAAPGDGTGWRAPTGEPIRVIRGFLPPRQRWLAGHRGVDLAAARGAAIVSAGPGVVTYAGILAGRGVVTVTHGTLRTTYEPVRATVAAGDRVDAGQQIGTLDAVGHCASQTCLHWGLLRGDTYLDPLSLLRRGPSRLLPVWPFRGG